ncbi:MAG: ABC-type sugar transport system substrate-binding protein [Rhodothermales bacterium]|jgi:ABC-type sugar transport system substrate-binding protein
MKMLTPLLLTLTLILMGCGKTDGGADGKPAQPEVVIGYIMAGPDIYYRTAADTFTRLAEKKGWEVSTISSEYSAPKEVANVENFIAKQVDVIILVTVDADVATKNAKRAKEAGIPLFLAAALPSEQGYHLPTGIVSGDWKALGGLTGSYIGKNWKTPRIAMIEGAYGQGLAEAVREGFLEAIKAEGATPEVVTQVSGGWMRKGGLDAAQDIIASQKEFDILYCQNEEMAAGALQAFAEASDTQSFKAFSNNGKEMAWEWLKTGKLTGTVSGAPTGEGDLLFQMVDAHLAKKEFPRHVYMKIALLTKDNLDIAVPWDIDNYFSKKAAGDFEMDLYTSPIETEWN